MAKLGRESSATGSFLQITDGTTLIKNGSTVLFANTNVDSSLDKTLTTESFGGISQASDAVISGANADQYSVVAQPALELYPTETDSFTLRFSPLSDGIKQAVVQVSGRSFNLSGVGVVSIAVLDQYANFTRASGAYHTQPDGSFVLVNPDEPRWVGALRVDHADGIDYGFGALGIEYQADGEGRPFPVLVEPAAENLITNPNDLLSTAYSSNNNFSDSGSTDIAPDGSPVPIINFGDGYVFQDVSGLIGEDAVVSLYIKANKTSTIGLRRPGSGVVSDNVDINLSTEWQRIEKTETVLEGTRFLLDNRALNGYGVLGLEVSIWGVQFESGSTATTFTDAPRTADNLAYCLEGLPGMAEDNLSIEYIDSSNVVRCAKITNTGYIVGEFYD